MTLRLLPGWKKKTISRQGDARLSFKELERLDILISRSPDFQAHRINHSFGKNSCIGHSASTRKKLVEDMGKWGLSLLTGGTMKDFGK